MKEISTLEEAQQYIYSFDPYQIKAEDQQELFRLLHDSEQIALAHTDKKLLCNTRIYLCQYFIHINDLEQALHIGLDNRNLAETEKLENEILSMYAVLFELYLSLGEFANIEEVLYLYKEKLKDSQNYIKLCTIEILTAVQANNLREYERCLQANRRAIEYALRTGNTNLILYAYNNLGYQYLEQDVAISRNALEKALELIEKTADAVPEFTVAIIRLNASRLYLKLGDIDRSFDLIRAAVKTLHQIKNVNELYSAKIVLADIYIRRRRFKNALDLLKDVEDNSTESHNNFVRLSCYQSQVQLYEMRGKFREALDYFRKFHDLNQQIFNEESAKKIRNLQILNEVSAIKKQRDHAEAMANLKHDFLANMSHEIRTPINSVLGLCYLLQREDLNSKQQHFVERLQHSGENLLALINDILDLSKIEAGKMDLVPETFNLQEFLVRLCRQYDVRAAEKQIRFQAELPESLNIFITTDPVRLSQVFHNLLSNALKFTEQGSITLRGSSEPHAGQTPIFRFEVADTGIGIAADKLQQVFGRYEQASASIKNRYGGTGLGLSITQKLTEMLRGTISVASEPGSGTTFTLQFPFALADSGAETAKTDTSDTRFLSGLHILLADDHEENRLVTGEILRQFNPEVHIQEAKDGTAVLDLLQEDKFDIILMDLDMPEQNGIETARIIRQNHPGLKTGIIAHTASLLIMSKEELLELGFDELLPKPFRPSNLLQVIRSVWNKKAG